MLFLKNKFYKKAFTLAEVLITLGVIGVVAALTIPILIQNANEKATVSALKKSFSTLSNAYTLAVQGNGTPENWGFVPFFASEFLSPLVPYLKIDKDCTITKSGCFPSNATYKRLLGSDVNILDSWGFPAVRLVDGTLIMGVTDSATCNLQYGTSLALKNVCGRYWVDINGYIGPNQYGIDLFTFFLTKYGIVPAGGPQNTSTYSFVNECKDKASASGYGCAAWLIYNENMDYLHCSDLDWGVKSKCN